ncbi:uncharacterized protein LOC144145903 isoform X2 [Haemaphysalis longicornis]
MGRRGRPRVVRSPLEQREFEERIRSQKRDYMRRVRASQTAEEREGEVKRRRVARQANAQQRASENARRRLRHQANQAAKKEKENAFKGSRARATSVTLPSLSPGKSNTLTQSIVPMRFQASQANVKVKLKNVGVQTRHTRRRRRTGRLGKKT